MAYLWIIKYSGEVPCLSEVGVPEPWPAATHVRTDLMISQLNQADFELVDASKWRSASIRSRSCHTRMAHF